MMFNLEHCHDNDMLVPEPKESERLNQKSHSSEYGFYHWSLHDVSPSCPTGGWQAQPQNYKCR